MVPGGTNYSAVDSPGGPLLGTTYSMTELAILTGLNKLQATYKLQNTLSFHYLPFFFHNGPRDLMSECAVGKVLTRHAYPVHKLLLFYHRVGRLHIM